AVLANKVHQAIDRLRLGNVELDRGFANVEINFAWCATDIAEIGICHFSRTIDDAAHDGDLHALEVVRSGFDASGDGLEVKKGAARGGTGKIIIFERAPAGFLKNVVRQPQ